jgi:hypothetical protein
MAPSAADSSPPTRIPKLKYRNPLPADQPSFPSRDPTRSTSFSTADTTSTLSRPSSETASLTSPSLASTHSSNGSWSDSASVAKEKKKKKASSVLGFLSLREPSQVALEQLAQQQRKQGSAKGTSSSSSASSTKASSINSKKIPSGVRKANSRWSGISSPAKSRSSTSTRSSSDSYTLSTRDSRNSQLTSMQRTDSRFSVLTDVSHNPPNSIASPMSSMLDISDQRPAHYVPQSPTVITQHGASHYSPDEPLVSPISLASSLAPATLSRSIAGPPPGFPPSPIPLDTPLDEYEDRRTPSPALSTDSADTIVRGTADAIFKKLNDRPHQGYSGGGTQADQSPERSIEEHDQEDGSVPESHDFLFDIPPSPVQQQHDSPMASPPVPHYTPRRPMQNFSRLMNTSFKVMPPPPPPVSAPSALRLKPASPGLPTLYEGSVASTESFETVRDNSDAQSVAASSIAPSMLSEQWYQNPRDRLGLGGRLRKGDAPRWKTVEEPQVKPKKNLLSFLVRSRS